MWSGGVTSILHVRMSWMDPRAIRILPDSSHQNEGLPTRQNRKAAAIVTSMARQTHSQRSNLVLTPPACICRENKVGSDRFSCRTSCSGMERVRCALSRLLFMEADLPVLFLVGNIMARIFQTLRTVFVISGLVEAQNNQSPRYRILITTGHSIWQMVLCVHP